MKKRNQVITVLLATSLIIILNSCSKNDNNIPEGNLTEIHTPTNNNQQIDNEHKSSFNENDEITAAYRVGFVDERFELLSLVFRLAGRSEYSEISTIYQRQMDSTFSEYKQHPVVAYTVDNLHFGYDAVFGMAIHLEKRESGFTLTNNTGFLFEETGEITRWTPENSIEFLELLNDFYLISDFSGFFNEYADYYTEHSERFANEIHNGINFQWFSQHGINPDNIRVVISPSSSSNGYGGWLYGQSPDETIVYAALPGSTDYSGYMSFVIHEFTHAISNPIAKEWYLQNEEFRRWSDDSLDLARMPNYSSGMIMAYEYVTRAYTILYMFENSNANLYQLFHSEIAGGFPYIQQVYALITDHEIVEFGTDISTVLGIKDYVIREEHSFNLSGRLIKWHFIDLVDYEIIPEDHTQTEVGNLFGSQTGEVLLVIMDDSSFLYIDLGSAQHQGRPSQHRMYSVYPLN